MAARTVKNYLIAAALAGAALGFAAPAMAQPYWGPHYYQGPGYWDYYGGAPGENWNPVPPAGRATQSRAARHNNCPTGTYGCY